VLRLTAHRCVDPVTRAVAFTFLVPHGWTANANLQWNQQDMLKPVVATGGAQAPDGEAWLALFPNAAFTWVEGRERREGTVEYGAPILRPRPAAELLTQVMLPSLRPGIENLRLVSAEPDPSPPWASRQVRQLLPGDDSTLATVEYDLRGRAIREQVSLVTHVTEPMQMPTMWGTEPVRYWSSFPALSLGAPVDRWDEHADTFSALRQTFRLESSWLDAVERTFAQMQQQALADQQQWFAAQQQAHRVQVQTGEQLLHIGQDLSNAMTDITVGGYEQRQATYDRVFDNQHLATMGVSRYDDPTASVPVELPYGYEGVWTDGQGGYLLDEDPSFDPNVGASGPGPTWQRLRKIDP
jgi:hypothetical protein